MDQSVNENESEAHQVYGTGTNKNDVNDIESATEDMSMSMRQD
jgi:hypothetical protein